uniref:Uncharacterized protein n=1 Tax=Aegilops tauschii subsp. strangulata TaxID=200361 RepID=A0A453EBY0_AEGTS
TRAFTSEGSHLGKQTFFEKLHPLVITNLYSSNNKISASAASIVLVGSSEELGIISNCSSGVLVGGNFAVKQMFPLLRILVVISCID